MKSNFHTHTTFCDGRNSIEENVEEAIELGFGTLGFSGHAMLPFTDDWHIKNEKFGEYCGKIREVGLKNSGKLNIRLGFEADFIPGITEPTFQAYGKFAPDFIIGSVHFVYDAKGFFEADGSARAILEGIEKFHAGSAKNAVIRYFEQEREMLERGGFSIIGHADLIRKSNIKSNGLKKGLDFFDEGETWYREQIRLTADAIKKAGVVAEINTGAMARGNMKTPYPSPEFLSLLRERNVPITIDSDAHDAKDLDFAFREAEMLAREAGYTETVTDFLKGEPSFSRF